MEKKLCDQAGEDCPKACTREDADMASERGTASHHDDPAQATSSNPLITGTAEAPSLDLTKLRMEPDTPYSRGLAKALYEDIFVQGEYARCGISVEGLTIDVGANIGMFSLFAVQKWPTAKVIAFEPIPPTFRSLVENTKGISQIECVCSALGQEVRDEIDFVHYPNFNVFSAAVPMSAEKLEVVINNNSTHSADILRPMSEAVEHYSCKMDTLSNFVRQRNIKEINLLKIDVEGAEMDVLLGVDSKTWPIIKQVVVEVEGGPAKAQEAHDLLVKQGFTVQSSDTVITLQDHCRDWFAMLFARRV